MAGEVEDLAWSRSNFSAAPLSGLTGWQMKCLKLPKLMNKHFLDAFVETMSWKNQWPSYGSKVKFPLLLRLKISRPPQDYLVPMEANSWTSPKGWLTTNAFWCIWPNRSLGRGFCAHDRIVISLIRDRLLKWLLRWSRSNLTKLSYNFCVFSTEIFRPAMCFILSYGNFGNKMRLIGIKRYMDFQINKIDGFEF